MQQMNVNRSHYGRYRFHLEISECGAFLRPSGVTKPAVLLLNGKMFFACSVHNVNLQLFLDQHEFDNKELIAWFNNSLFANLTYNMRQLRQTRTRFTPSFPPITWRWWSISIVKYNIQKQDELIFCTTLQLESWYRVLVFQCIKIWVR